MAGPLEGIRVIDLTSMISGPLGSMILADQGADVIKIESPRGDNTRAAATQRNGWSASFVNNNRSKRSVVLDLKREGARDALLRLIAGADVVMQNFRPGVVERLGIDYEAARAVRGDIVLCVDLRVWRGGALRTQTRLRSAGPVALRAHHGSGGIR